MKWLTRILAVTAVFFVTREVLNYTVLNPETSPTGQMVLDSLENGDWETVPYSNATSAVRNKKTKCMIVPGLFTPTIVWSENLQGNEYSKHLTWADSFAIQKKAKEVRNEQSLRQLQRLAGK